MSEEYSDISLRFCKIQLNIEIMKSKLILLLLSIAVSAVFGTPSNAKPSNSPVANNAARSFCCLNDWRFNSLKQDFGSFPYTQRQASDWNQIAILSKPYRSGAVNTAKPFSLWRFNSPKEDLGNQATSKLLSDWNQIAILSKPYRPR